MKISVQTEDFDVKEELSRLRADSRVGGLVAFVGTVRDFNHDQAVSSMTLEYYPGMTERSLRKIALKALERWKILDVTVIHRVGKLSVSEQIVLVAVSSAHRGDAFDACEFIIDYLKTEAPFWKKEEMGNSSHWVEAKDSDERAKDFWNNESVFPK